MTLPNFVYDAMGLAGAGLFVIAFGGMQLNKLDPHKPPAILMNLVGAVLILISLVHDFNLGSFVLETIWALIAAYSLIRYFLGKNRG